MIDNDNIIKDKMCVLKIEDFTTREETNHMQKQALMQGKEIYSNQKMLLSSFQDFMNVTQQKLDVFFVFYFANCLFIIIERDYKLNR